MTKPNGRLGANRALSPENPKTARIKTKTKPGIGSVRCITKPVPGLLHILLLGRLFNDAQPFFSRTPSCPFGRTKHNKRCVQNCINYLFIQSVFSPSCHINSPLWRIDRILRPYIRIKTFPLYVRVFFIVVIVF